MDKRVCRDDILHISSRAPPPVVESNPIHEKGRGTTEKSTCLNTWLPSRGVGLYIYIYPTPLPRSNPNYKFPQKFLLILSSSSMATTKTNPTTTTWIRGKCIGRGAFGAVHLAFDRRSGDVFAVKSVDASACLPSQRESLEDEITILRSLPPSPFVVRYLGDDFSRDVDSGLSRNLHLEYLPGGTVADLASYRSGKFSEVDERVLRSRVRCVVDALRHLHGNGIVHCDVKGRNVLVGSEDEVAKLVDFGSAVRAEDLRKSRVVPRGSPLWMAPEVVRGETLGPKSDVWSLGCTVIEMVTGKPAWEDEGIHTLTQIGYSNKLPEFPIQLSDQGHDFLEKCLRRDYADRWSCEQLLTHPFLATDSSNSIAIRGSGYSPRCILEWTDYESEEDEREVPASEPTHGREEAARCVIGGLSSSDGANWEWEGSDWVEARDWESDTDTGGEGTGDWAGAGMEFGNDQEEEFRGEAGSSWQLPPPHHYHYYLPVDVEVDAAADGTCPPTSHSPLPLLLLPLPLLLLLLDSLYSHPNPNYYLTRIYNTYILRPPIPPK
ncbi:hypothetical protein MLD38_017409 [Melastoma candidum]|uniref:Uncharacterized protein n=1 Tax=Melastoma candidum TaxID=119954 RepID=A0ACB9QQL9_9MYRT|nr:hypothetical protein MLD38_017409 [Melastoma candidum]